MGILVLQSARSLKINYDNCLPNRSVRRILIASTLASVDENQFDRIFRVDNYETSDEVIRLAESLIEDESIEFVIARAECDLIRAAHLREKYDLSGQRLESAIAFRDKFRMKELVSKSGVKQPVYALINGKRELLSFAEKNGYPVVVKPRDGSGGAETHILLDENDIAKVEFPKVITSLLVETFASSVLFHTDGLVVNGSLLFFSAAEYINDCLAFQRDESVGCIQLDPKSSTFLKLKKLTERVLASLPTPEATSFHAEFFLLPDGEFAFCEIASRSGGARIVDTIVSSYGINLDEQFVRFQCEGVLNPSLQLKPTAFSTSGYILVPPRNGRVVNAPESAPFSNVFGYKSNIPKSGALIAPKRAADNMVSFLAKGNSKEAVMTTLTQTAQWYRNAVVWEKQ